MEHLIAGYLYQSKSCPLPYIGKLALKETPASISPGAKLIEPGQHQITLLHGDYSPDGFVNYISAIEQIEGEEAMVRLQTFCNQLLNLDSFAEVRIPCTGKFYINAEGNLVFKHSPYPTFFLDAVPAEKVMHPDSSHSILVGDKESNSTLMTEYYNEEEVSAPRRWWIGALLLALVGLAVISLYFVNESDAGIFGNATKTPLREAPQTYTTPK